MTIDLPDPDSPVQLAALYRAVLLDDVMPFWLRHGLDPEHGECFGYLHRDGTLSQHAKGNMFKGPFHLPRVLWFCARELLATNLGISQSSS